MKLALLLACLAALGLAACGPGGEKRARTATTTTATVPAQPPEAREPLVIGIGEQRSAMFADVRFATLGITNVRVVVAYDAVSVPFERELADVWINEARRVGATPMITFGHSRVHPRRLPSVKEFRIAFRAFRERYPGVRIYSPWNEPNHSEQPTRRSPRRAAEYFNVVSAECLDCTVLAGELLDQPGMMRYLREYRTHLAVRPKVWSLHNYADANRLRTSSLRALLASVEGDIWLTETGGLVRFAPDFPHDERRAARALAHVMALARANERVKRIYIYNWTGSDPGADFDSGLIGPDGAPRPAYETLRHELGL